MTGELEEVTKQLFDKLSLVLPPIPELQRETQPVDPGQAQAVGYLFELHSRLEAVGVRLATLIREVQV
jgi:hypothetical protein